MHYRWVIHGVLETVGALKNLVRLWPHIHFHTKKYIRVTLRGILLVSKAKGPFGIELIPSLVCYVTVGEIYTRI